MFGCAPFCCVAVVDEFGFGFGFEYMLAPIAACPELALGEFHAACVAWLSFNA